MIFIHFQTNVDVFLGPDAEPGDQDGQARPQAHQQRVLQNRKG